MELEDFIKRVDAFALERDWVQFHSVRNLVLAMVGEVGELAEVFQWVSDDQVEAFLTKPENHARLQEELADVLMYALRLASVSGVDVMGALEAKLASNAEKYPVDKSKGSAKKYTDL
jgi:NTP pyrophosphatase (non-canonical NTP hydrolase)